MGAPLIWPLSENAATGETFYCLRDSSRLITAQDKTRSVPGSIWYERWSGDLGTFRENLITARRRTYETRSYILRKSKHTEDVISSLTIRTSPWSKCATLSDNYEAFLHKYFRYSNFYSMSLLPTLKAVLKSKLTTFWYISEATFYRKHVKCVGTFIFTIENRLVFFVFQ